jgi:hypothetical protein
MLNGDTVEGKVRGGGFIQRALAAGKTPDQVIESIYIRSLSRKPTADELAKVKAAVAVDANPQAALEDVFWAVLNSREFMFNH